MNGQEARVLIVYHSYNGPVGRLADGIADGARSVAGATVKVKSVEMVTDEDLQEADGIAIGSPKCIGHFISPEIYSLIERLGSLRDRLHNTVGTAFSGSHSSYGGQETVYGALFHAMLCCNMLVVGHPQATEGWSDFVGGVIVEDLDEKTCRWAAELGARLALAALLLSANRPGPEDAA